MPVLLDLLPSMDSASVELAEDYIDGAKLDEPLEKHNILSLKYWLLCRGIKSPSGTKKATLLEM